MNQQKTLLSQIGEGKVSLLLLYFIDDNVKYTFMLFIIILIRVYVNNNLFYVNDDKI